MPTDTQRPNDLVGYQFHADDYCGECLPHALTPTGFNARVSLPVELMLDELAEALGVDRACEETFDSTPGTRPNGQPTERQVFPKVLFRDQCREARGWGDDAFCGRCSRNLAEEPAIPAGGEQ